MEAASAAACFPDVRSCTGCSKTFVKCTGFKCPSGTIALDCAGLRSSLGCKKHMGSGMDYVKGATEQAASVMKMDSMPYTSAQAMLPVTTQNIAESSAAMLSSDAVQSSAILSVMLGVFIIAAAAAYLLFARLETQEAQRQAALSGEPHSLAFRLECCPLKRHQRRSFCDAAQACYREAVWHLRIAGAAHIHMYSHQLSMQSGPPSVPFPRHCACASQGTLGCRPASGRAHRPCRSPCPPQKARLAERAGARRLRRLSRSSPPSRTGTAAGALMRCVLLPDRPVPHRTCMMATLVQERCTATGPAITKNLLLTKPVSPHQRFWLDA